MCKLHTKRPILKRGSVAMVMVVCIVVVYTMLACCTYSVIVSKDQMSVSNDTVDFANTDATLNVSAKIIENSIKRRVQNMKPANTLPGDYSWFSPDNFVSAHGDQLKQIVADISVMDYELITVAYVTRVPQYVHEENTYYYDCIVISIVSTHNRTYNLAFYINDSEENSGDGLERQKGTYLFTWIS